MDAVSKEREAQVDEAIIKLKDEFGIVTDDDTREMMLGRVPPGSREATYEPPKRIVMHDLNGLKVWARESDACMALTHEIHHDGKWIGSINQMGISGVCSASMHRSADDDVEVDIQLHETYAKAFMAVMNYAGVSEAELKVVLSDKSDATT